MVDFSVNLQCKKKNLKDEIMSRGFINWLIRLLFCGFISRKENWQCEIVDISVGIITLRKYSRNLLLILYRITDTCLNNA